MNFTSAPLFVIPAKAGSPLFFCNAAKGSGIPAFAGTTVKGDVL
jgi:hypothetical protein